MLAIKAHSQSILQLLLLLLHLIAVKSRADFEHFKKKEKFAKFDEDVLRDYVEYGTVATEKGVKLFFSPNVEAKIYHTLPHYLPKLRGKLKVPAFYIGGTNSREARLARLTGRSGFAHLHPNETNLAKPPDALRPELNFKITIPSPGRYVIWAQVNLAGSEVFVPFWVDVRP